MARYYKNKIFDIVDVVVHFSFLLIFTYIEALFNNKMKVILLAFATIIFYMKYWLLLELDITFRKVLIIIRSIHTANEFVKIIINPLVVILTTLSVLYSFNWGIEKYFWILLSLIVWRMLIYSLKITNSCIYKSRVTYFYDSVSLFVFFGGLLLSMIWLNSVSFVFISIFYIFIILLDVGFFSLRYSSFWFLNLSALLCFGLTEKFLGNLVLLSNPINEVTFYFILGYLFVVLNRYIYLGELNTSKLKEVIISFLFMMIIVLSM